MQRDAPSTMQRSIRGTVTDRPWGLTLAALGLEGRTGQLTLRSDGRAYRIAFFRGAVVAASSPLAVDSVARVALTNKMITPAQANELKVKLKNAETRDEVEAVAAHAGLSSAHADLLRNRVITQRAARTFAVDLGEYVLEDRISDLGVEGNVDVRSVIYQGVRMNLSQQRIAFDLRQLGSMFVLPTDADVAAYGFADEELPVLEALRVGTSLAEIEAANRNIDPRTAQAIVYALVAGNTIVRIEPQETTIGRTPTPRDAELSLARTPTPRAPSPSLPRSPTPREPTVSRLPTPREPTVSRLPTPRQPMMTRADSAPWEATSTSESTQPLLSRTPARPQLPRAMTDQFAEVRPTTVRPNALSVQQVKALIGERMALLDRGTDHFELLGLPLGASAEEVKAAYLELARYLEPKKLAALGITDEAYLARRLFAQVCIAFTVLTDPERRADYIGTLAFDR